MRAKFWQDVVDMSDHVTPENFKDYAHLLRQRLGNEINLEGRNYLVFAGDSLQNGWRSYRGAIAGKTEAIEEAICYHDATFRQVVDVLTGEVIWEENDA